MIMTFPVEQYSSANKIAKIVGCHPRTVEMWANTGAIEQNNSGFPLIASLQWQLAQLRKQLEAAKKKEGFDPLYDANVRLKTAEAELKELDLQERKGELVEIDKVMKQWQAVILNAKTKLLGLPTKLSYELAAIDNPNLVESILHAAIEETLNELTNDS